jgi:hypothetical protein
MEDVHDAVPPTASPTPSPAANGSGWNSGDVTVEWNWTDELGGSGVDAANCTTSSTSSGEGAVTLSATCKDLAGNEGSASYTAMVDTTAPSMTCSATPDIVGSSNHKMVSVTTTVTVEDGGSESNGFELVSVTSSEPDNGLGDGDAANDIQGWAIGTADTAGQLRAERSGTGTGRVYTLTYEGTDRAGNAALCSATVKVPRYKGT